MSLGVRNPEIRAVVLATNPVAMIANWIYDPFRGVLDNGAKTDLLAAFAVLSVVALAGFDLKPSHGVCGASRRKSSPET